LMEGGGNEVVTAREMRLGGLDRGEPLSLPGGAFPDKSVAGRPDNS